MDRTSEQIEQEARQRTAATRPVRPPTPRPTIHPTGVIGEPRDANELDRPPRRRWRVWLYDLLAAVFFTALILLVLLMSTGAESRFIYTEF